MLSRKLQALEDKIQEINHELEKNRYTNSLFEKDIKHIRHDLLNRTTFTTVSKLEQKIFSTIEKQRSELDESIKKTNQNVYSKLNVKLS